MTKVHLQPKEKPKATKRAPTLTDCRRLARIVLGDHGIVRARPKREADPGSWHVYAGSNNVEFISVILSPRARAMTALHAALTVLAGAK